jgi:DNA replication protein DnaC
MTTTIDLDAMLRRLHLPTVRRLCTELELRAETENLSYREYLTLLIAEEVAHRCQTRIQRAVRRARFPFLKTFILTPTRPSWSSTRPDISSIRRMPPTCSFRW